jgi:hypothetical protein
MVNSAASQRIQVMPFYCSRSASIGSTNVARSADGQWAAFAGDQFYLYSSAGDSLTSAPFATVDPPQNEFGVRGYALNSDGSKIAVVSAHQVTFLGRSFNVLGTVPIPGAYQNLGSAQFSMDGSRLFLFYGENTTETGIEAIDANAMVALGYFGAEVSAATDYSFLAVDNNGRILAAEAESLWPTPRCRPSLFRQVGTSPALPAPIQIRTIFHSIPPRRPHLETA